MARLRLNRSATIFIVAAVVGIGAMLFARRYIDTAIRGQLSSPTTTPVVVASADLPKGAVVSPDTMLVREVPVEWLQSQAVLPEQFERVRSMKLAYPLRRGEMLLWPAIESSQNPNFSAHVAEGRRALTVPVDDINSISGMLEPRDQIDLYVTLERDDGRRQLVPVMQGVNVLAAGNRVVTSAETGRSTTYSTITLDVSVQEAEMVTLARQAGKITAMLRNPGDEARTPPPANLLALLGGYVPSAPRGRARSGVQILYGDRQLPNTLDAIAMSPEAASMDRLTRAVERLNLPEPPVDRPTTAASPPPVMAALPGGNPVSP